MKNSNGTWFTDETKEMMKAHCLEKFGTAHYFQSDEFKEKQNEFRTLEKMRIMTFGKSRFKNEFEMLRFCNRIYVNVIGGASKLFKHFLDDHPEISEIVSFADRRWSQGNLYEKLNFSKVLTTPPNYCYICWRGMMKSHRVSKTQTCR